MEEVKETKIEPKSKKTKTKPVNVNDFVNRKLRALNTKDSAKNQKNAMRVLQNSRGGKK